MQSNAGRVHHLLVQDEGLYPQIQSQLRALASKIVRLEVVLFRRLLKEPVRVNHIPLAAMKPA